MSLRVLLFSPTYPGEPGGVQSVVNRLTQQLRQRGHHVVKAWAAPNPDPDASDLIYTLPRLNRWHGVPTPRSTARVCRTLLRVARDLGRQRPQVVNVHFVTYTAAYFLALRPVFGYRLVLSVHGSDVLRPHRWDLAVLPWLLRRADAITVVSERLVEQVRAQPGVDPARIRVVRNGIDYAFWSLATRGATDAAPTVLCVGRLHAVKGQDVLLHSFALVRRRIPGARLVIVGDGPAREELQRLAEELQLSEAVLFTGALGPADVRAMMSRASVFVLPSRSEGLPLALLEAMAAGVPVIATRVGGVPEVLTPDTGVLVPSEDHQALADAITESLQRSPFAEQRGERARDRASAYAATTTDAAYEDLYAELVMAW